MTSDTLMTVEKDGWPRLWQRVTERDEGCIARRIALTTPADPCLGWMTVDHVWEEPMMDRKAPDDEAHLVSVCQHHHLDGWSTSHRSAEREYLRYRYPEVWG